MLAAADSSQDPKSLLLAFGVLAAVLIILLVYYMAAAKKSAVPDQPVPVEVKPVIIEKQTDDGELIAVISAAVQAYLNADTEVTFVSDTPVINTKFRVVSFRKVK